jgi:hypothetical protein
VRFYVRVRVQREVGWDDAFLLFGLCCLVSGLSLIFVTMDLMYMIDAILFGIIVDYPPEILGLSVYERRMSATGLILMWFSICSVKFSFLALFKQLIRQMPRVIRYWWFVAMFNLLVTIYGAMVYIISCPYFSENQVYQLGKFVRERPEDRQS